MTRIIVVSGGGSGIGQAVAQRFARDGEQVVIVGRRAHVLAEASRAIRELTPSAPPLVDITADLAEPAEAEHAAGEIVDRFERVDVLVSAAGGNAVIGAARDLSGVAGAAWHWSENFRLNTLTAVLFTEALRGMLSRPGGRVLLVSSIAAYRGSGSGSYGGAKAALHPYAYDLAADLGPDGITVNVVAPGYIAGTEFFRGGLSTDREQTLIGQTHTGRAGVPDDVAETVHWLASAGAAHVTAQIIQVNGGAERGR